MAITTHPPPPPLASLARLQPPVWSRRFAWLLLVTMMISPVALVWIPWQQNINAMGRVVAFDPTERQQEIESPVYGRIKRWHVKEGQQVSQGQLLVTIEDPDPGLVTRLAQEKAAIGERQGAARKRITAYTEQTRSLAESKRRALAAVDERLKAAEEAWRGTQRSVKVAMLGQELAQTNFAMEEQMRKEGLTSELAFQTAKQRRLATLEEQERARNAEAVARIAISALRQDREKIASDAEASINSAQALREAAEAELAGAIRDLAILEVKIARQAAQDVTAPCDCTIFRVLANGAAGGNLVKEGDRLLIVTPRIKDNSTRMVELFLDGNDAPQVVQLWRQRGQQAGAIKVRLQFEGWPAIQTIGWPTTAIGTFGGQVVMVDQHDDGKGRFRILVEPDPDANPWPGEYLLRQGARAQGWLLLDNVSIGYELWRRFNGFPPVLMDKDDDKPKPAKVKVPK